MVTSTHAWVPVLEGRSGQAAREAVDAIIADLIPGPEAGPSTGDRRAGDPFIAILFAQAARQLARPELAAHAIRRLDIAISGLATELMAPTLFGGFSGVAWVTTWLARMLPEQEMNETQARDDDDSCLEIDATLLAMVSRWDRDYDLISGLVGFGVYALERLPNPSARRLLEAVIEQLELRAVPRDGGLTWWTRPELLAEETRAVAPEGYYNLGVAHGVPGVTALLGHIYRAGVAVDRVGRLLEGNVPWLLSQQLPEGDGARYASWTAPGAPRRQTRMAWCYGGLGLSAALMIAARALAKPSWEDEAARLALMESARASATGVNDACVCHGAAGNGFIFQRFYHATGDPRFFQSARDCFEKALEMRRPGEGIGGYLFHTGASTPPEVRAAFLSGAAGVALALLAAAGAEAPTWDRLLLTDIPSR